jgi:sugar phosphate isomerase/epimerase
MKLGMLTACLPGLTLEQVSDFAARAGLEALELAAWPREGGRPFHGYALGCDQPEPA